MSDLTTKVMLASYEQDAEPTLFLSGMFRSPRSNFHNSEKVEIDIIRSEEDIAIAVQDLSTGARWNSEDLYTNKEFTPTLFKEGATINAHKLLQRMPGQDPFQSVDFMANATERAMRIGRKMQRKILRAIEQYAAQVLTTGTVTLVDSSGTAIYSVDFKPKATHFPTAGTAWSAGGSTKLADLESLANVIRTDGLASVDWIGMGEGSYELFIKDSDVLARLDTRRVDAGAIVPMNRMGNGGIYRGALELGNYRMDIYTYDGQYKHPSTGTITKYIPDDKVIMRASQGRLDATFGGIPRLTGPDPRIPSSLTSRISVPGQMMDLQFNGYFSGNGEALNLEVGTRPFLMPTAIDTYGCLDTGI